jgi:5,10-methylenetetrahydromethanopterin reductase
LRDPRSKGLEVATELADGLFTVNGQTRYAAQFSWAALAVHGTVLADGEALDSPRVQAADITGELEAFHTATRTAVGAVAHDNPGSGLEP